MAGLIDALMENAGVKMTPPLRQPYGQRYNSKTGKLDSAESKSFGFFGPLSLPNGDIASEYSSSAPINGREVDYPTIAEGMPQHLLQAALTAALLQKPPPPEVADFAYDAASRRVKQGKSPFWTPGVDQFPKWSPDQNWPDYR